MMVPVVYGWVRTATVERNDTMIKRIDAKLQEWYMSIRYPWNQIIMGAIGIAIGVLVVIGCNAW